VITSTKFYKPKVATLTKNEVIFFNEGIYGKHKDSGRFGFILNPTTIMTRRIAMKQTKPGTFGMGAFQITYNFSKAVRDNRFYSRADATAFGSVIPQKEYGAKGWSFRALYEFLCEYYNGGYPFIDTYFGQVFKSRPVCQRFLAIYDDIQDKLNAEQFDLFLSLPLENDRTPDMSYAASKRFADFRVWQNPIIKNECKNIAKEIRDDIVGCLKSGLIPMSGRKNPTVADNTRKTRARLAGIHPNRLFFASGRLISKLNIFVEIDKGVYDRRRAA